MKKLLILVGVMLLSFGGMAQTSKGVFITPTISTVDVRNSPLSQGRLGGEFGYMGNTLGLAATAESNPDLTSEALVGLKGYLKVADIENMRLHVAVGAKTYAKDLKDSPWEFTPQLNLSIPMFSWLDAKAAVIGTMLSHDDWKVTPGVGVGLAVKL